ncbi:MAG: glycosyltransferase family 2 protein [Janthinobacterium lividum]
MSARIPNVPPIILPVANTADRPLWSVMIPAYNCISFLGDTLKSVLVQDRGEAVMQIAVVDDCSTDGDVAALVEAIGKGRIQYFRQEQNSGSLRNFETCLNRAKGQWIHLLHGDDRIEKGYYQEIESLFAKHPEAGAAFTNNRFISRAGESLFVKKQLLKEPGILKDFLLKIAQWQLLEPAAITVKRSVYEELGSFYAVHYGEDWEMWTRIAAHYPVAYSPKCLASYRVVDDANITQQSYLTSQNVRDMIKVIDIIQTYLPPEKRKKLKKIALKRYSVYFSQVANNLYPTQKAAAFIQAKEAWNMHQNLTVLYYIVKLYFRKFISYKGKL